MYAKRNSITIGILWVLLLAIGIFWYSQENKGYTPKAPGDDFWQFNAFAGYRFPRRKAEVALGLLNITDQDYRLAPLNVYNELPRTRTLVLRLRLSF